MRDAQQDGGSIADRRGEILRMIAALKGIPGRQGRDLLTKLERRLSVAQDSPLGLRAAARRGGQAAQVSWRREQALAAQRIRERIEREGPANAAGAKKSDELLRPRPQEAPTAPGSTADDGPYVFRGTIHGEMLSDMLQLVSSNGMTGVFSVAGAAGTIQLHCVDGKVVHAEGQGARGEEAFFAAFACTSGTYVFRDQPPSDQRTIDNGTQFLILEALRRIDEGNAS